MDKSKALRVIRKFIKTLKREGIAVDRVILYGSYAKGNARPDSDIDVAVVCPRQALFVCRQLSL